jgi:hypothetical protein
MTQKNITAQFGPKYQTQIRAHTAIENMQLGFPGPVRGALNAFELIKSKARFNSVSKYHEGGGWACVCGLVGFVSLVDDLNGLVVSIADC